MAKYNAVMIDLEFLDTRPSAAILTGAFVPINTETYDIGEGIKFDVNADDCMRRGMTASADTIRFWATQAPETFKDAFDTDMRYRHSLELFLFKAHNFIIEVAPLEKVEIWQYGTLDAAIITKGCDILSKTVPFRHWNVNDFRVLKNLFPDVAASVKRVGPEHQCLHDARHQAAELMAILKHIRASKPAPSKKAPEPRKLADLDDDL